MIMNREVKKICKKFSVKDEFGETITKNPLKKMYPTDVLEILGAKYWQTTKQRLF